MSGTKVIVAGAGIAGPVLAMFLKLKGYNPIIYERTDSPTGLGLSLGLQPNGLKVLALIPGLVEKIVARDVFESVAYSSLPEDERELARFPLPMKELSGYSFMGARRPVFLRTLIQAAEDHGIPIVFNHQLVDLEQHEESVTVKFANGKTDDASFVVGCDGLHSNTRICLFGKEEVSFTGLTQTGGESPFPDFFLSQGLAPIYNLYGDGVHMIGYPINEREISWAITQREAEAKETWRAMDEAQQQAFKEGPFSKLPFGAGELVRTAGNITKYGLYDRPELKSWHKGRVVLIGDAAHPTSPHLGQGANQAFEDVYHLIRLLIKHNPTAAAPSTTQLEAVFTELEDMRIEQTSALVKGARQQGDIRVVSGVEACKKRNELIVASAVGAGKDQSVEALRALYADRLDYPFLDGQSEI